MSKFLPIPPFPPLLSSLILAILLTRTIVHAAILCTDPYPLILVHEEAPTPSDCRHILTHLPSLPILRTDHPNDLTDPHAILDPSSPFLPKGYFLHGACNIYFSPTTVMVDAATPMELTATGAREVWAVMREEAARIVEQCAENHQAGFATNDSDAAGFPYTVEVNRPGVIGLFWRSEQRRALTRPEFGFRDNQDLFSKTYYYL